MGQKLYNYTLLFFEVIKLSTIICFEISNVNSENSSNNHLTLKCNYQLTTYYTCFTTSIVNSYKDAVITKVTGNHLDGYYDSTVEALVIKNQNMEYLPLNIGEFFKNLKMFEIENSNLGAIFKKNFALMNLKVLKITNNPLKEIPSDIFEDLNNLENVVFSNNNLSVISPEIIKYFNSALRFDFSNNPCLNGLSSISDISFNLNQLGGLFRTYCNNNDLITTTYAPKNIADEQLFTDFNSSTTKQSLQINTEIEISTDETTEDDQVINSTIINEAAVYEENRKEDKNKKIGILCPFFFEEQIRNETHQLMDDLIQEIQSKIIIIDSYLNESSKTSDTNNVASAINETENHTNHKINSTDFLLFTNLKAHVNILLTTINDLIQKNITQLNICQEKKDLENLNNKLPNDTMKLALEICKNEDLKNINNEELIQKLEQEKKDLLKSIESLKNDNNNLIENIRQKEQENEVYREENKNLRIVLEDNVKIRNKIEQDNGELEQDCEKKDVKIKNLKKQNLTFESKTNIMKAQFDNKAGELSRCNQMYDKLKKEYYDLSSNFKSCQSSLTYYSTFNINCDVQNIDYETSCIAMDVVAVYPNMLVNLVNHQHHSKLNRLRILHSRLEYFTNSIFDQFDDLRTLEIINSSLLYLNKQTIKSNLLSMLKIEGNFIDTIPNEAFVGVPNLQSLSLTINGIENIQAEAFKRLTNLKTLNLSQNKLSSLDINIFSDLISLTHLSLSNNQLKELPGKLLSYQSHLQVAKFDYNPIDYIEDDLLDYTNELVRVHFEGTCVKGTFSEVYDIKLRIKKYCLMKH